MLNFREVKQGFEAEDDVEILRVATNNKGDIATLVKLKGEEKYQLAIVMEDGREAFDTYFEGEFAQNMFNHLMTL